MRRLDTPTNTALLGHHERRHLGVIGAFIAALHVLGWGTLIAIVVPQHLKAGGAAFGLGIGATAYVLGVRHAFDADHIAAIDNTTRRMMRRGERPLSVGFWFALGHSTIVLALALLIAAGARSVPGRLLDGHSGVHSVLVLVGTMVSAAFLYAIALMNLRALSDIWRLVRRLRGGDYQAAALDEQLAGRGLIFRIAERVGGPVEKPWHMYVVGLLFGLGFDTATEIALLVVAGTGSASGLPWYAVLCLPVLFAAGMSLLDTLDGTFMNFAYSWSLSQPVRKIYYNLTVTGLSVAVALIIGTIELLGLAEANLRPDGPLAWLPSVNLNAAGFIVAGLFCATWIASALIWRYARIEQRWGAVAVDPGGD